MASPYVAYTEIQTLQKSNQGSCPAKAHEDTLNALLSIHIVNRTEFTRHPQQQRSGDPTY